MQLALLVLYGFILCTLGSGAALKCSIDVFLSSRQPEKPLTTSISNSRQLAQMYSATEEMGLE